MQGPARRSPEGPRGCFLGPPAGSERVVASSINLQPLLAGVACGSGLVLVPRRCSSLISWGPSCLPSDTRAQSVSCYHRRSHCSFVSATPSLFSSFVSPLFCVNTARAAGPRPPSSRLPGFVTHSLARVTRSFTLDQSFLRLRHTWRTITHSEHSRLDPSQVHRRSFHRRQPQ